MRCIRLMVVLLFALSQASCSHSQMVKPAPALSGDEATLPTEFARVLRDYERAWQAKDAQRLSGLFAADGFVLSSGSPPVRGRSNIERHYAGSGGALALRAMAWAMQENVGYIVGEYAQDATFANPGKFTLTLVRDDGHRWLIFSDMDNGNTQPESPHAAPSSATSN
jgi:ketosteroid isomerase-like protein